MTTTSDSLLDDVVTALKVPGATDAGSRVFKPGDWPTSDIGLEDKPQLKLRAIGEELTSLGRASINFTVVTTVRIMIQAGALASMSDETGGARLDDALWRLQRQVLVALINSYPLTAQLQQFPFVRSSLMISPDGDKHLGTLQVDIGLEYAQGPEDFAPIESDEVARMDIDVTTYPPAGETIELSS